MFLHPFKIPKRRAILGTQAEWACFLKNIDNWDAHVCKLFFLKCDISNFNTHKMCVRNNTNCMLRETTFSLLYAIDFLILFSLCSLKFVARITHYGLVSCILESPFQISKQTKSMFKNHRQFLQHIWKLQIYTYRTIENWSKKQNFRWILWNQNSMFHSARKPCGHCLEVNRSFG